MPDIDSKPPKVFISYAHENAARVVAASTILVAVAIAIIIGSVVHARHVRVHGAVSPSVVTPTATKVNPKDGAVMVYVPAGPFLMGGSDQGDNPVHTVTLSGYYIYKNDVTEAMYKKFCDATGHAMPAAPPWGWGNGSLPIVNVTWDDARAYCDWAGVHLPTEAQWEKAARGTDGRQSPWGNHTDVRQYPWGDDWDSAKCANSVPPGNLSSPKPVGSYPSGASPYGIMDMAGNVWNWCSDWYDEGYWKSDHGMDPAGPASGNGRVLRGGSWFTGSMVNFRASTRNYGYAYDGPMLVVDNIGLRGASGP
ncbi:MAG: formylglycine-generating enzyme family protein [Capsulimonadaceae bacterium]